MANGRVSDIATMIMMSIGYVLYDAKLIDIRHLSRNDNCRVSDFNFSLSICHFEQVVVNSTYQFLF